MAEKNVLKVGDRVFVAGGALYKSSPAGFGVIFRRYALGGCDVKMDDGITWDVRPEELTLAHEHHSAAPSFMAAVEKVIDGACKPATDKTEAQIRKERPVARGVLDYFPDAIMAVAELSRIGNEQHNPGQPMHWAREKSTDHADCIVRHLIDRDTVDTDGVRHSAKVAWRALALLQTELEAADPELKARRGGK